MDAHRPARGLGGASAEEVGHQLVAEADADDRPSGIKGGLDEGGEFGDPGQLVIDAVAAAGDDVEVAMVRRRIVAGLSINHLVRQGQLFAGGVEQRHEHARIIAVVRLKARQHGVGLQNAYAHESLRAVNGAQMISK